MQHILLSFLTSNVFRCVANSLSYEMKLGKRSFKDWTHKARRTSESCHYNDAKDSRKTAVAGGIEIPTHAQSNENSATTSGDPGDRQWCHQQKQNPLCLFVCSLSMDLFNFYAYSFVCIYLYSALTTIAITTYTTKWQIPLAKKKDLWRSTTSHITANTVIQLLHGFIEHWEKI